MINIESDSLISIDNHFKISAGPGAGKTHWLTEHIKNVLKNSTRLGFMHKIACITYTNTAVEEIQTRLTEVNNNRVEVSTIHSFLYKNVVKPYAFLITDGNDNHLINLKELDGHDENVPFLSMYNWKKDNMISGYFKTDTDNAKIYKCLQDLTWDFEKDKLVLTTTKTYSKKINKYSLTKDVLYNFKIAIWKQGLLHHEDVLYFSYRILTEYPKVLKFLSIKFPYVFVDEFQDTSPIQTKIIKMLGEHKSIVGVIGDSSQSIYKFQGATRQDFGSFDLPHLREYYIKNNRRSTDKIINFINKIRNDKIIQKPYRNKSGKKVKILIGDKFKAKKYIESVITNNLVILSRSNDETGKLKFLSISNVKNLWDDSKNLDSNYILIPKWFQFFLQFYHYFN